VLIDRIIFVCTIIIAVVYLYGSTLIAVLEIGDPLGPKAFPRLLAIALLFAAGLLALEMWRAKAKNEPRIESRAFEPRVIAVLAAVVAWTGAYYLLFEPLGYVIATAIFLLPLMAFFNPRKWTANIATAVLFAIGTYWLFGKLEVALPKGVLPL